MADVLTPEQRRFNMSRIRCRDTKPELALRRGLHALGFRFRLHARNLPGRPDLVFSGRRAVIFVHGCFWHGHTCPMCRPPTTRAKFWKAKIESNRYRDDRAITDLAAYGWRTLIVWECATRGPARLADEVVLRKCASFLLSNRTTARAIEGAWEDLEVRRAK